MSQPSVSVTATLYRGADKSLARPGRKQAVKHVRDTRDFNNIETRSVIKLVFLQGKAPKEIRALLTKTLACLLPGRAKNPVYNLTSECVTVVFVAPHIAARLSGEPPFSSSAPGLKWSSKRKLSVLCYCARHYRRRNGNKFWIHPLLNSRHERGVFYTAFNDLRNNESKFLTYFRTSVGSSD